MEVLPKNHPRFCARYVGFIGKVVVPRNARADALNIAGKRFDFVYSSGDLAVGDEVYIAKLIPTHRSLGRVWEIHKIVLAESYFHYQWFAARTEKEKRKHPYQPYPETWFGSRSRLIRFK